MRLLVSPERGPIDDPLTIRLEAHRHPYPVEHLAYAGAGHGIFLPQLPTTLTAHLHPAEGRLAARQRPRRRRLVAASGALPG